MKTFIQNGDNVDLVAPYAVTSGQGALVGSLFSVATTDVANGAVGEFKTRGVVTLNTDTGAAFAVGDIVYWDNSAKDVTKTSSSNTKIGCAMAAKLSGGTTCAIRLNGTV